MLQRDGLAESMKQRNDFPSGILSRENRTILFGDSYVGRNITQDSNASITADDLRVFAQEYSESTKHDYCNQWGF